MAMEKAFNLVEMLLQKREKSINHNGCTHAQPKEKKECAEK
jgi:hypothetical protein